MTEVTVFSGCLDITRKGYKGAKWGAGGVYVLRVFDDDTGVLGMCIHVCVHVYIESSPSPVLKICVFYYKPHSKCTQKKEQQKINK